MAIPIIPALLPVDNDRGSDFGPQVLRNRMITPARKSVEIVLGTGRYYGGSISYSPLVDDGTTNPGTWLYFKNLWDVCNETGHGCLYWDHNENQLINEPIGTGDGVNLVFQLHKQSKVPGTSYTTYRKITRPVQGWTGTEVPDGIQLSAQAISLYDATAAATLSPTTYDVDTTTGIVTFHAGHAPISGHAIQASGYFFVPVVFEDEKLPLERTGPNFYIKALRITEVSG